MSERKHLKKPSVIMATALLIIGLAASGVERVMSSPNTQLNSERKIVKRITGQTSPVPFAGIGAKTPEDAAKDLEDKTSVERLAIAQRLQQERLWSDAEAVFKNVVNMQDAEIRRRTDALVGYASVMNAQSKHAELEATLEEFLAANPRDWRLTAAVSDAMASLPTHGSETSGGFVYDVPNGSEVLSCAERRRVRRLQILRDALPFVREEFKNGTNPDELWGARFYNSFIALLSRQYWLRQELTNLDELPDYEPQSYEWMRNRDQGAPVDEDGAPIFYHIPESFETAKNDGERVQALRAEEFELIANQRAQILRSRADESRALFGVETLASYSFFTAPERQEETQAGIWALNTLKDSETIAKLASGVKRFELPEDYDYLSLLRESLEHAFDPNVWIQIAREYEARRQFDQAADVWRNYISILKDRQKTNADSGSSKELIQVAESSLSQIVDPRVAFDEGSSQVMGKKATIVLRHRNAQSARLVVRKLKVDALFNQLRQESFYKDGRYVYVRDRLIELIEADAFRDPITEDEEERIKEINPPQGGFIGEEVAKIDVPLEPDPNHYDGLKSVDLSDLAPGAYLIVSDAKDGPKDSGDAIVVWLCDSIIVRKPVDGGARLFIVDSESGAPRANTQVDFTTVTRTFNGDRSKVTLKTERRATDVNGSLRISIPDRNGPGDVQRLTVVKTPVAGGKESQYSFLDFEPLWTIRRYSETFQRTRAFFVSDRPIYRPNQKAEFKFWVGDARYDAPEDRNSWSGKTVAYQINAPTGEVVARKANVTLDEYGAFSDSFELPGDAKLGVYQVSLGTRFDENDNLLDRLGYGAFRLEEYRKPEFKVAVDAPKDPIALGDMFKATVRADYYFGAPVANAKVSYKVTRHNYQSKWYPARYWDWFYGCGYWQFPYDAPWYPGWSKWGFPRLSIGPSSFPGIPEVVSSGEGTLNEDGTFEIEIDSSLAKLLYPNDDQTYEIEAEVVDESRRSITGKGQVYAARQPFSTAVWFDRGYYKTGDKMTASFQARRIDGKAVEGDAVVKLYQVTYEPSEGDEVKPIETEVFSQTLKTDENGMGSVEIAAGAPGQYRLSSVVTTKEGIAEEGGQLVVVAGTADAVKTTAEYRFNSLEIIPDKPEYAPGDTARLQFSSSRPDARVVLFLRPENGVVDDKPIYLSLKNGVAYYDLAIEKGDQPNIFVEASTVFDGRLYTEQKELAVPPQKRVLDIGITPEKERVKPGEKTKIKLRLTDPDGAPVVGQTVVTVYDESLDALSGGSNVEDVRKFFWMWRRHSSLNYVSSFNFGGYFDVYAQYYPNANWNARLRQIGPFGSTPYPAVRAKSGRKELRMFRRAPMAAQAMSANMAMGGGMEMAMAVEEETADASVAFSRAAAEPMGLMAAAAAPMAPAAAPMAKAEFADFDNASDDVLTEETAESVVEPTVRKNLADVAYWAANLVPEDDGVIEIEIDMPENLTTWKIAAWSVGMGLRVGAGEATVITTKDVVVRMEKPRFLTRGDEAVLSAIVHNYSSEEKKVRVALEFPDAGDKPAIILGDDVPANADITVPIGGQQRVDWSVRAVGTGEVALLMKALATGESDAIQDTITVNEHGIDRQLAFSGFVPPLKNDPRKTKRGTSFTFNVPKERREDSAKLIVRFSPTLAGAIVDAIPYLTEYPYGCTEQTLNRFLPAVVAQKALLDMGVDLETIAKKRANLNAQEIGDPVERAQQWQKVMRKDPIFDTAETRRLVAEGVAKLQSMQNSDGGWGWFYGHGELSSPRLTALITRGLRIAQNCDQAVDNNAIYRGVAWLQNYEREQALKIVRGMVWSDEKKQQRDSWGKWKSRADGTDAFVYYALTESGVLPSTFTETDIDYDAADFGQGVADDPARVHAVMKELLWDAHASLELYTLATYGLALAVEPSLDEAATARLETILRVFKEYRVEDEENQTVWLDLNRRDGWLWWSWFGSEFETQAYYLRLLNRADDALLEKLGLQTDAARLVKYLLNNRKHATYWNSTRDTAICVEAFAEYLESTNELNANQKVSVKIDGATLMTVKYTPETLFDVDGSVVAPLESINTGVHTVTWTLDGEGPLYCNAYYEYFTLEDPIEKSGLEIKAERNFYKLTQNEDATTVVEGGRGQAVRQRVDKYDRAPLKSGDELKSGDLVEVEILIDSKNDYESIMIRDFKAAGLEAEESQSGYRYDNGLRSYVEFRDANVCFFVENLPQGKSKLTYRLRAETPGVFSALPTAVEGMYAPELKGNSDEFKAKIVD
ncbi:MAG: hypothetical protein IJL92_04660 [Thermoguttaceae bacterium]|nr:hypothetical protein [Thermoguttaceae bacterium]